MILITLLVVKSTLVIPPLGIYTHSIIDINCRNDGEKTSFVLVKNCVCYMNCEMFNLLHYLYFNV